MAIKMAKQPTSGEGFEDMCGGNNRHAGGHLLRSISESC